MSAGIFIPDGLHNVYNYHAFSTIRKGVEAMGYGLKYIGLEFDLLKGIRGMGNGFKYVRYGFYTMKNGFLDATGGHAWRLFGAAGLALAIAGLALRNHEQQKEESPSIDPSSVIILPKD